MRVGGLVASKKKNVAAVSEVFGRVSTSNSSSTISSGSSNSLTS